MSSVQPRRWRRLVAVIASLIGIVTVVPVFSGTASAHHSEISATVGCDAVISWTASSWTTGLSGANSDVRVYMDPDNGPEVQIGSGVFPNQGTIASFSGTIAWPSGATSVKVRSVPVANWGNGSAGGDGRSVTITKPADCPNVTVAPECVNTAPGNGEGKLVITLTNSSFATSSVSFRVYPLGVNSGSTYTWYDVAPGGSATHTFTGLADGTYNYHVRAYTQQGGSRIGTYEDSFTIDCDFPAPSATITSACVDGNGKITVTLNNTGGESVTFTVTTPSGSTETHTVNASSSKTVNYSGLADAVYTVTVKVGSTTIATQQVTIDCDQPNPSTSISQSCVNNDGTVVLTLTNSGTEGITFTVKHPVTAATEVITVGPNSSATRTYSGLNDGSYTITITAPGFSGLSKTFTVKCDQTSTVSHTYECVGGNGKVVVTMHNNGDDVDVVFVVAGTQYTVSPGQTKTHTITGLSDTTHTINYTIGGVAGSFQVTVSCDQPGSPQVQVAQECADEDGKVTVTLKNVGGELPLTFVVNGNQHVVNANSQKVVVISGLTDGQHTITITQGQNDFSQTVTIKCDQDPTVQHTSACVDEPNGVSDGSISITLFNNGDDVSITFTINGAPHSVGPKSSKTVTIGDLTDGDHTFNVAGGGKTWKIDITVDCDKSGEGSVGVAQACVDKDGKVTFTLTATGGELPVLFTINGAQHSVAANTSKVVTIGNLVDGPHSFVVTSNGVEIFNDELTVDCDPPPTYSHEQSCVDKDGSVVFTLTNNGDDVDVTFTINGTNVVVPPGQTVQHTVGQLSDGPATITVSIDGVAKPAIELTVDCDPAPTYTYDTECADNDGSVVFQLTNNGDDVSVTFTIAGTPVVVGPGQTVEHTVGGFNDGAATVTLLIDGVSQPDIKATFTCDQESSFSYNEECADKDGSVVFSLTNGGDDSSVTFTVNGTDIEVDPGQTVQHTVGGLADGQHTITVAIDGVEQDDVVVSVDCDPAPTFTYDTECADNDGSVVFQLTNNGDDVSVTFTVAGVDVEVQPGQTEEYTVSGLNDGEHSVTMSIDGVAQPDVEVEFNCDQESSYSTSQRCSQWDGEVVFSLTNGSDDVETTFTINGVDVVVDPNSTVEHVVSGLADGEATITVSINGVEQDDVVVDVDCDPTPGVVAECNSVDIEGEVDLYWFTVTNTADIDVEFSAGGSTFTLGAGASKAVSSASAPLSVLYDGVEVASAAATEVVCENEVVFEKVVLGAPPTGETYTIRVSRLMDDATYQEELTFDLDAGVPQTIMLPSTLDPAGIEYLVEEIDAGTANTSTVSQSQLTLNGHLGETISVVITNGYAAVQINKQSLTGTVTAGGTITYVLQAQNTGGLTLDPVVITDRLPAETEFVSVSVEDNAGLCSLTEATRPQLLTCVMDDSLAPGALTKPITLVVKVDAGVLPGTQILNQAKVLGTWDTPSLDMMRRVVAEQLVQASLGTDLSCLPPIDGTVCDLSAKVGVPVSEGDQGGPTTTAAPTTTIRRGGLPETGGGSSASTMLLAGFAMAAAGALMLVVRRRPRRSNS